MSGEFRFVVYYRARMNCCGLCPRIVDIKHLFVPFLLAGIFVTSPPTAQVTGGHVKHPLTLITEQYSVRANDFLR